MIDPTQAIANIDAVLTDFRNLMQTDERNTLLRDVDLVSLLARAQAALNRYSTPRSAYSDIADRTTETDLYELTQLLGVLDALKADLQAGYLRTVAELLHADTFDHFLDMANGLLDNGYKDPAAVLGGSVLETQLRLLCDKASISTVTDSGADKKADSMNVDLRKASIYNMPEQKQVTASLAIRNSAAHGKYHEYEEAQVRVLLEGVRLFLIRYPA